MRLLFILILILIPVCSFAQIKNEELRLELKHIDSLDQAIRREFDRAEREFGSESEELKEVIERAKETDRYTSEKLSKIVDVYGWPGKSLVGIDGALAAWLIAQHSDSASQERYLPLLKEAVDSGESEFIHYCFLLDRVKLNRGEPQVYGTQVIYNQETKEYELYLVEDEMNLNKRRKEAGMEPIEEYLKNFNDN